MRPGHTPYCWQVLRLRAEFGKSSLQVPARKFPAAPRPKLDERCLAASVESTNPAKVREWRAASKSRLLQRLDRPSAGYDRAAHARQSRKCRWLYREGNRL